MTITEEADFYGEGCIVFQANERSEEIIVKRKTALIAAEKAMDAIIDTIPPDTLTPVVIEYVMKRMEEILHNKKLKL